MQWRSWVKSVEFRGAHHPASAYKNLQNDSVTKLNQPVSTGATLMSHAGLARFRRARVNWCWRNEHVENGATFSIPDEYPRIV